MPDVEVFRLPDVGEGLTEADVVTWHVKVGDAVAINDALVDVETAKSVVELPSPYAGVVLELHVGEGDTVPVGHPLISIAAAATPGQVAPPAVVPGSEGAVVPTAGEPAAAEEAAAEEVPAEKVPAEKAPKGPLILVGTGPKEAVPRRVHLRRPEGEPFDRHPPGENAALPTGQTATDAAETRIPIKGVRKVTAETMVRSAFTAPHASMWTTVDVTASVRLVERLKRDREWSGVRVSPLLVTARTVALAVREVPDINASWDDATQEIVVRRDLNLGIAAATPRGLMVPNIKGAGSMSLRELAMGLDDVVQRARAGALEPADMRGGTLTLTNVGTFGVEGATPILNPPEAAIIALGAIQQRPWVVDGQVEVRDVMTLSISIDHRLVDGELGATFLRKVAMLLHDPGLALL
ncbi:branched-chain alpha-keto acid dehydrogenase subunit E2 [Nocardioides gansuensis]|uniref:Dihydrolipoamide acetyltransferase component of pyruvate dehydrogenase complex n=1 Tax=Nocardioides gansuensis TaxID=2138300 RepID=A0A2T8FD28_9ACTN|nr:dihydrolipoamide acetyltransferase family protein [Nocardioides gansuensis]PVG83605.1 branched-chain alpha-keto acid dehydrogenase subunit E2 [Nocardioides gansuensis]